MSAATNLILLFVKPLIVVVFSGVTRPLRSPRFFSRFRRAYHRSTENRQRITPVQQGKPNCLHNFNLTCEHYKNYGHLDRYQEEPTNDPVVVNSLMYVFKTIYDSVK